MIFRKQKRGVTPACEFFFLRMAAATHPMTDQFSKDRLNGHTPEG